MSPTKTTPINDPSYGRTTDARGRVVTPRGDTVLSAGDEVVVFALPDGVDQVEKFFTGGAP